MFIFFIYASSSSSSSYLFVYFFYVPFITIQREDVDLVCSTLENAVGSVGGFSVGTTFIVENQRLSGLGYCFSASAPPLLVQAAISALDHFEKHPEMFSELNEKCIKLNE